MNTRNAPQTRLATFLFGGLIGFVIGLVLAGVVAVWIFNSSSFRSEGPQPTKLEPLTPKVKPTPKAPDDPKSEAERIVPPPAEQPAVTPPPAAAKPDEAAKTAPATPAASSKQPEPSPSAEVRGRIWLQVGAYASAQDAEAQRARFAMMGHEAQVQQADVPGKGLVYRVRVGPYVDADEASRVRGDLARQGIEVSIARPSGG